MFRFLCHHRGKAVIAAFFFGALFRGTIYFEIQASLTKKLPPPSFLSKKRAFTALGYLRTLLSTDTHRLRYLRAACEAS